MRFNFGSLTEATRVTVTIVIMLYFGGALILHYNTGLEEALKNVLLIVVGFWMGSAKRSTGEPVKDGGSNG